MAAGAHRARNAGRGVAKASAVAVALLLAIAVLASGCAPAQDPTAVGEAFVDALNDHDVDRVVSLFAPDAVVVDDREMLGSGRIREWANALAADAILLKDPKFSAEGSTVSWVARQSRRDWRQIGIGDVVTRYQAQVRDGKIVRWTATFAGARASEAVPTNDGLAAIPVVLLGLGMLIAFLLLAADRFRGRPEVTRPTQGTLLSRLQAHVRVEEPNRPI